MCPTSNYISLKGLTALFSGFHYPLLASLRQFLTGKSLVYSSHQISAVAIVYDVIMVSLCTTSTWIKHIHVNITGNSSTIC